MDQIKKIKVGSTYYSMLPEGGTAGQVLKKNSATDFDVSWGNDSNTQSNWIENRTTDPSYVQNRPAVRASTGNNAIIEGDITNNIASGQNSHAEGNGTKAIGSNSHAEGNGTKAYGIQGHAEGTGYEHDSIFKLTCGANDSFPKVDVLDGVSVGIVIKYNNSISRVTDVLEYNNEHYLVLDNPISSTALTNVTVKILSGIASGQTSHSEGLNCIAGGDYSHSEGSYTKTQNNYEHSQGRYNKTNRVDNTFGDSGNTIHSIGIGTSDSDRKNSIEVMQNGDVYVYGVGDYDGTNPNTTGVKTLQSAINDSSSELEVEEATFPSGAAAGATRNFNIVLVDGSSSTSPYDPQSGNVITINNADSISGLGVRQEHLGGGTTLYCDNYSGDINYAATIVPSGKVLIGSSNNKGSFRATTQDVPTSTSVTSYTSDYIVGGQALFKATERYITSGNSITNINANYNVGYYTSWWGSSTPSLGFSAFPTNKHMTLFIMGELTTTSTSSVHNFTIPLNLAIGTDKPMIFLNGDKMTTSTTIAVENNCVVELDAYYVVIGTEKHLIIRVDSTVTPIN